MPAKKFRFVSPGVQVKEIDKSKLPAVPAAIGPVVIGRTARGPGMVPVTVSSYEEFVEKFGAPDKGAGSTDVWRNGNTTAPLYASYAAEAWLKNSSPLTMVRLMGIQDPNAIVDGKGEAGWKTDISTNSSASIAANGGAWGLFLIPSSSTTGFTQVTGTLGAIFYLDEGALALVGDRPGAPNSPVTESSALIGNSGDSFEFRMKVFDKDGETKDATFNLNKASGKYIRKVFNTNPTLTNNDITPQLSLESYWLGETFETNVKELLGSGVTPKNSVFGFLAPLTDGTDNLADFKGVEARPGKSGWVFGQDLNANYLDFDPSKMPKLFRLVASEGLGGDWEQNNIKISIMDIKPSVSPEFEKFGTFSVGIRKVDDIDANPEFIEVFTGCSLDPSSPNFIAAKIGDRHLQWDPEEKRHRELGEYPNRSKYVRVEMNPVVEQGGLDPELLPFGFMGPARLSSVSLTTGELTLTNKFIRPGADHDPKAGPGAPETGLDFGAVSSADIKIVFPSLKMRKLASDAGVLDDTLAFFGVVPNQGTGAPLAKLDEDFKDLVRAQASAFDQDTVDTDKQEYSFMFSLDDLVITGSEASGKSSVWVPGSRKLGTSYTSLVSGSSTDWLLDPSGMTSASSNHTYVDILSAGHNRFTMPLVGGTDGLNIKERDPFRNSAMLDNETRRTNYALHSAMTAIESVREPEVLNMNLLVLPGITNKSITKLAIDTCEQRADALAIVDLEGGYKPSTENSLEESKRLGSVKDTVQSIKDRNLNTSYGCAYYPWVKVLDSESGSPLWMPPSVVALGTMASSQENSQLWFAPAGFNRGGLSLGSSGLSVVGVREKLSAKQRDSLYEVNVNPIASFPSEGIVIFGQKTLQAVPSALDRINVRRLVIFLKKQISVIAAGLLFEPNVQNTWDRFKKPTTAILESVKNGFGISDYKLVLDSTTTTPEEIDRNMMYAKLFIKPVYAIEFIGIDFIITNTGASFEDL